MQIQVDQKNDIETLDAINTNNGGSSDEMRQFAKTKINKQNSMRKPIKLSN